MTTPRIEDMMGDLRLKYYKRHANNQYPKCMISILDSYDIEVKQALTQAHQAGRDEAVEVINKEIAIHTQLMGEWTGISITDAGIRRIKTNPHQEKVETLNDVLKALQDNK